MKSQWAKTVVSTALLLAVSCGSCEDSVDPAFHEDSSGSADTANANGGSDIGDDDPASRCVTDECRCGHLPATDCDTIPGCVPIGASRVADDGACDGYEEVGCFLGDICDNNIYWATDSDDRCWQFGGGCIPSTFDASAKSHEFCVQKLRGLGSCSM